MAFDQEKIKELYPEAIMYEAMKINKGSETVLRSSCNDGQHFGQLKKDGYWYQFEKHNTYSYLFSRSASTETKLQSEKLANVPHIQKALDVLPANTILVGEIYYPGGTSKDTTKIMGCLADKAISRQNGEYGLIHYYIHDILMYDGLDFVKNKISNWKRYQILSKIFEKHNLGDNEYIELAEAWRDDLYSRVGSALSAGEEGMVIKADDGIYEPGKRPITMIKAKKVDFADVIIIGFEPPNTYYEGKELDSWSYNIKEDGGRLQGTYRDLLERGYDPQPVTKPFYYGWLNARIKIGVYDGDSIVNIGTIHSGISDEMKQDMSEHPEKYLNKVAAIQMMETDKNERTIRHGFFKYMRDDKDATDCKVEDIFGQSSSMLF